jgi:hypothetical protein
MYCSRLVECVVDEVDSKVGEGSQICAREGRGFELPYYRS